MRDAPLVSVVVPTYNRGLQTVVALNSVLAQTYRTIEVVVVDDGSTDGSVTVIRDFVESVLGDRSDSRYIRLIRQHNRGPSAARNVGVREASGDYIAFLDSDDVWLPDKLTCQIRALQQFETAAACITDARCIDRSGMNVGTFELFGKAYPEVAGIDSGALAAVARSFCGFWLSTLLIEKDIFFRVGALNDQVTFAEDRDFFFRLCLASPLLYVNRELAQLDRSISPSGSDVRPWDRVEVRLEGQQRMYENWLQIGDPLPTPIRGILLDGLRRLHSAWASWYLERGRYERARQHISQAMKYGITTRTCIKWALTWAAPSWAAKLSSILSRGSEG